MIVIRKAPSIGQNGEIFIEDGILHLTNQTYAVPQENVIYNQRLLKEGVIAYKEVVKQKLGSFIIGEQEYYKVKESNIEAKPGDLIVVRERTAYAFELNGESLAYFGKGNVLLIVSERQKQIIPGPDFMLLQPDHDGYDSENIDNITKAQGYYFTNFTMRLYIKGKLNLLVAKTDIKIQETP